MKEGGLPDTERVKGMLDAAAFGCCEKNMSEETIAQNLRGILVNFSQNPGRRPVSSSSGNAQTLTTSSQLYSFERDRVLLGLEHLRMQGWPDVQVPEDMSDQQLKELAGEGMALPCIGSILFALYLCKGFPTHIS